jgi:NAD(P)-dependent dehydrogenase (short-subunit alcohol dehydrogenase family)
MDLGKVVMVTGASSGFGRLMVETLARKSYRVYATMRAVEGKNANAAGELRELASKESLWIRILELDVTSEAAAERATAAAIEEAGQIDVLINNAGYGVMGIAEAVTTEQAQKLFDTNFFGAVRMNRAVLPQMRRQQSGLLMHISSGAGRLVFPAMGFYCASKYALEALTEVYRYELAAQGIDSVSVEPGTYRTSVFNNIERAQDTARNDTYGPLSGLADRMLEQFSQVQSDPQEVADAVLEIIETPAGKRKLRYRVSVNGLAVDQINELSEKVQEQVLEAFGVAEITKFKLS